jgi:hypothetical protein
MGSTKGQERNETWSRTVLQQDELDQAVDLPDSNAHKQCVSERVSTGVLRIIIAEE